MAEKDPKIQEIDSDSDEELNQAANPQNKVLNRAEKKSRKAISKLGLKPFGTGKPDSHGFNAPDHPGQKGVLPHATGKIIRVTVKKQKNILFVISNPDVYRSTDGAAYVIFGEARIEDMNQNPMNRAMGAMGGGGGMPGMGAMANMMAQNPELAKKMQNMNPAALAKAQQAMMAGGMMPGMPGMGGDPSASIEEVASGSNDKEDGADDGGADGDAKPVEEKDVELVVTQVGCTREKAIAALKANKNDIVEAIMSFNM